MQWYVDCLFMSLLEREEMYPNEEVGESRSLRVQELHECADIQTPLLWPLQRRALLHPTQHQNHPGGVPLPPGQAPEKANDVDQHLCLSQQLSSE